MTFRLAVAVLALGLLSACNKKCDATSCATGCCDAAGACVSTPSATACGASGAQCVACGIGQTCQAGFCAPNGVTGGGGGSGGGVGGGAGGGGGGGSNATLQQLLRDVYTAYCGYMARCGAMAAADVATCADLYTNSGGFGGFTTAEQAANIGFTGDYTQCIADLATISCEAGSSGPPSCRSSPQPRGFVATGGACVISSVECADVLDTCTATCPRTCQRVSQGGNGQSCRRAVTATPCDTGLFCNAQLVCQPKGAAGAPCNGGDECQSGACSSQVCVALPSVGQACRASFPSCDATTWCNASDVCTASKSEGASCSDFDNECLPPLGCSGGTCRTRGGVGAVCSSFRDCAGELGCDELLHTCQEYTDVATGQACTDSTRNCANRDERCLGAAMNPDGGVGTFGTCVASTTGGRCSGPRNCLVADYCNAAGTCTPRFATNAQCETTSSGSSCLAVTDVCIATPTDAVRRCRPRGAVGAPCVNASACSAVLACVNLTCVATGHPGEPCFGGAACVGGACGSDGGCQGPGTRDAGCFDYSQCHSGICRDGHCAPTLCP